MVALLIKSRTGPSQPDLGGKERGGEGKGREKRDKVGKRRKKEGEKEKLPLRKMCRWSFNSDAFLQDCVTLNATCVLLFIPAAHLWLNYAKYVEPERERVSSPATD